MKAKPKFPENLGSLVVEGAEQATFWIRAFKLEEEIRFVQQKIFEKPERTTATAPIIGHYTVDDKLTFYYALSFDIDSLGTHGVIGKIWYCSPKHRDDIIRRRNDLGDKIMKMLDEKAKRVPGEMIPAFDLEIENYEPKKETGENPLP